MDQSHIYDFHPTSFVGPVNQGRVPHLGRCSRPSPYTNTYSSKNVRIIQCNINGLSTIATRLKLDRVLEMADKHQVDVTALRETKLGEKGQLRVKGYHIVRKDRGVASCSLFETFNFNLSLM